MTPRRATEIFIVAVTVLILGWTSYMAWTSPADTVSNVITDTAMRSPLAAFLLGVVAGHWFWPKRV